MHEGLRVLLREISHTNTFVIRIPPTLVDNFVGKEEKLRDLLGVSEFFFFRFLFKEKSINGVRETFFWVS